MSYERDRLPDPVSYYKDEGLILTGPRNAKWKTAECRYHGGSDSMRINTQTGAFVCMAGCGAKGGDVLAYQMAAHDLGFIEAAKALGAWTEDGKPTTRHRPTPLSPRAALEVLATECNLVAIAAGNLAHGMELSRADLDRVLSAAGRITRLVEVFA
jgi:hypothetical protein